MMHHLSNSRELKMEYYKQQHPSWQKDIDYINCFRFIKDEKKSTPWNLQDFVLLRLCPS